MTFNSWLESHSSLIDLVLHQLSDPIRLRSDFSNYFQIRQKEILANNAESDGYRHTQEFFNISCNRITTITEILTVLLNQLQIRDRCILFSRIFYDFQFWIFRFSCISSSLWCLLHPWWHGCIVDLCCIFKILL